MSKSQVVTLRMPVELKRRLEREARYQGVSLNQLTNYLLTIQLTQLELISDLENRLAQKSLADLKGKVRAMLAKVPSREVADWDVLE
ncbi:MAG: toxin-antitoxin system HicB family antitoxin [Calditrichaeota bacterium]|nr:toxin-antitoxin system HicB family antitoxin [Calditrichota bacterium]MCB0306926.1 toxin-antitoxin system HicB family antitoxin [Calditrichota bacterium]